MFKLNGYVFCLKMITYWKNILLFWINSAAILKKDFDSKPVYNKKVFENQIKFYGNETINFHEEVPTIGSTHICLIVITVDSPLKTEKTVICKCF